MQHLPMQVSLVVYEPSALTDDLYNRALTLIHPDHQERIRRFYRREDACRSLIGRLLPRVMLRQERNIANADIQFDKTEANKPFLTQPALDPPVALNVSHDNALVAMVHGPPTPQGAPVYHLGVDVMQVRLPQRESFLHFVQTFRDQLTRLEQRVLLSVPQTEGIRRFFWIWTMKEAYTKALGLGLGFDFARIEYDVPNEVVRIDDKPAAGWEFIKFTLWVGGASVGGGGEEEGEEYLGVAARYLADDVVRPIRIESETWVKRFAADEFVKSAIEILT